MYQVIKVGLVPGPQKYGVQVSYSRPESSFAPGVGSIFEENIDLVNRLGEDGWKLIQILPSENRDRGFPEELWFGRGD